MKSLLLTALFVVLLAGCTSQISECSKNSDCQQPLCLGTSARCDSGKCVDAYPNGTVANCTNASIDTAAANYCMSKGYQYKIETDSHGIQTGYCYVIVPLSGDTSSSPIKCEEWAFYRGDCPSCKNYCEGRPHIECVGYWNISGSFPDCKCQYLCSNATACTSDSDCPKNYTCYYSKICSMMANGGVCGGQSGDLLCHKVCNYGGQCPSDMPYCRNVDISQGDVTTSKMMCMRQECERDWDCPGVNCIGMKSICVDGTCKIVDSKNNSANCGGNSMSKELCEQYSGHWNECGSACTGEPPGMICPAVCIPQCECGGIAGWQCPPGYNCKLSGQVADELGVCEQTAYS